MVSYSIYPIYPCVYILRACVHPQFHFCPPIIISFIISFLSLLPCVCVTAVVMDKYMLDREDVVEQQMTKEEHEIKMKTNMAMLRINQLLPGDYDESYGVKR